MGIVVEAQVILPGSDVVQRITSGGLWGIESDSGDYLAEVEADELAALRQELGKIGFGERQISAAMRNVEHSER